MEMRSIIIYACWAVILLPNISACRNSKAAAAATGDPSDIIRVMSYNIHHANPPSKAKDSTIDIQAMADVIIKAKPDLVALQEVDNHTTRSGINLNQAQELGRLTGMHFYFSRSMDYRGGQYGNAVLSRFPILDTMHFELPPQNGFSGEVRSVGIIKVKLPGKKNIHFASTHLDATKDETNRLWQAKKIIEVVESLQLPFIIAGDFNARPDSKTISLLDQYFTRSCITDCPPTIPVVNPRSTIDYIMYRPAGSFETLYVKTINEPYASDHLPVVAEFKIK